MAMAGPLDEAVAIDLRAQPLGDALRELAKQSNLQLLFDPELVEGQQAPAVAGKLAPRKVLQRLLRGTKLEANEETPGVLVIRGPATESAGVSSGTSQDPSQAASEAPRRTDDLALEEVMVTAQKREQRLQEVPIAITALSSEALGKRGTVDLADIAQLVPSLNVSAYPDSSDTVLLNMRGQGTNDPGQITKDGGVGLYIDGFYIARPQAALFDIGDPERVEVLRGPQGTLYGRNTTGGAINIITKKPAGELGGSASVRFGSRNYVRALADIDLPRIGDFAIKAAVLYSDRDGWVKNPGAAHNYQEFGQRAGRMAVRWTPSDAVTVDYAWDRGEVLSTQPYYVNPDLEGAVQGYFADKDRTYTPLDIRESEATFVDHQLTAEWRALDSMTFRSLSSYRDFDSVQFANYGVALSAPSFPTSVELHHTYRTRQFTQELQLIGELGDRIEYTGGLYYFREKGSHLQLQDLGLLPFGITVDSERLVRAKSISKAAYLQATWTPPVLEDRMKLTVGGRYTRDEREASRDLSVTGFPIDVGVTNDQEFSDFSPAVNLAMQWTPRVMMYAKASKAYKAGGSAEGGPDFRATYDPEEVTSYELGLKSQLFGRMLTLNTAAFRNEFDGLQVDLSTDPVDSSVVATSNAGKATVSGLELELIFQPVADLGITAAYAYLDPKLKSIRAPAGTNFDPAINPGSPVQVGDDVTGYFVLAFAPENALSLSADWTFLRLGPQAFSAHTSYKYQESMFTSSGAGPIVSGRDYFRNDSTRVLDARLTFTTPIAGGKELKLSLYGNNLTDDRYKEFVIGIGTGIDGFFSQAAPYSEPRAYGIEGRLVF